MKFADSDASACFLLAPVIGWKWIGLLGLAISGQYPQTPLRKVGTGPFLLSGGDTLGSLIRLWGPVGTPGLSMGAVSPRVLAYPPRDEEYVVLALLEGGMP